MQKGVFCFAVMNLSYKRGWRGEVQELSYGFVFGWLWIIPLATVEAFK